MRKSVLVVLICALYATFTCAQTEKKWDYPIKPGTKEWLKLEDNTSMVKACQIPEAVLKTLSTEDLFKIVLDYPLIYDIYAFNDVNDGIEKLMDDFNGIRELFKRSGTLKLFIDEYVRKSEKIIPVLDSRVYNIVSKGDSIIYLSLLETLSTTKTLLENSSAYEKQMIIQALDLGYKVKTKRADYFSGFGFRTFENSIKSLKAEKSIEKEALSSLSYYVDTPVFVYTPMGSQVPARKTEESSIVTRAGLDVKYTNAYPAAQKIITYDGYSSTRRFNCHGYAWHRVENGNNSSADVWIGYSSSEGDPEKIYRTDGSYIKQTKNTPNAKIVWASGDHTAVNIDNTWCISKWNEYPLMRHKIGYSPYGSKNLEYYTKTPVTISGPSMVGGTSTASYAVNYIPYSSTLTWHFNTALLTLVSSSEKGIIVKPKTPTTVGDATIIARLSDPNGNTKELYCYVGINGPHYRNVKLYVTKSSDGSQVFPSGGLCPYTYYYARIDASTTLTNVNWGVSTQLEVLSSSDYQLYFRTLSEGWGILNISAKTIYGVTKPLLGVTLIGSSNCSNTYYSITSSASSNILYIKFDMNQFNESIHKTYSAKKLSFDIRIYNSLSGNLVKQARSSGEDIQLDISNIPDGIYIVHIYDGISDTPYIQKIAVKH